MGIDTATNASTIQTQVQLQLQLQITITNSYKYKYRGITRQIRPFPLYKVLGQFFLNNRLRQVELAR